MKYILLDIKDGTILGLEVDSKFKNINNWYTATDEAYEFILDNNGSYIINIDSFNEKLKIYETLSDKDKELFIFITENDLVKIVYEDSLDEAIYSLISKNSNAAKMYILNGITFKLDNGESKKQKYEIEDQVNIEQLNLLVTQNLLDEVPIKFHGDEEYSYLSISEFKRLYNDLLYNKYWHLFYLRIYNNYIKSIDDINKLHRLSYETGLPAELRKEVDEKLKIFKGE